jgi:hypothetical protein
MPQAVTALLVGAGIVAGVRWLAKEITRVAEATRLAHDELSREEKGASIPVKDLGTLVWDPKAGAYRPSRPPQG